MDVVFAKREATVHQVAEGLSEAPTPMAVRRMLHLLVERGFLNRRREGKEVVYFPARSQVKAGANALKHVLDTYFGGAIDKALAAHLSRDEPLSSERLKNLRKLIKDAQKEGQ